MPYAAITYNIKPGFEDAIAEVFANFRRVTSPVLHDESGEEVGRLLGTGVFIRDGFMVRFIHYSGGTISDIGRHMAEQDGVREIERLLKPYIDGERNTDTPQGWRQHFENSTMRCISQFSSDTFSGTVQRGAAATGQS